MPKIVHEVVIADRSRRTRWDVPGPPLLAAGAFLGVRSGA
jgi:hypothetical protein